MDTDTVMKMGLDARLSVQRFAVDEFENLLNKYKALQESGEFTEESFRRVLAKQVEITIADREHARRFLHLLEMLREIMEDMKNGG